MKNKNTQTKNYIENLLGEATITKASGAVFTLAGVVPVILAISFMVVLSVLGLFTKENTEKTWYAYSSMLLNQLGFVLVILLYLSWTKIPFKKATNIEKCPWKYFIIAIVLQFGLLSLSSLNEMFLQWLQIFQYEDNSMKLVEKMLQNSPFFLLLVVLALLPALLEEIIFRGFLLKGLQVFGTAGAVLICGGLFSLYHQNPAQTLYQFCCGAAFALLVVRAGSILPTMLAHFLNNAIVLLLYSPDGTNLPMLVFVLGLICLIGVLVYLIFIDKRVAFEDNIPLKEQKQEKKNFWTYAAIGILICIVSWGTTFLSGA